MLKFYCALGLALCVQSIQLYGQDHPAIELHVKTSSLITANETSLDTLRLLITEALPGSTVKLAYFILEDDLSTSALVQLMTERAEKDGVKFQIIVDYIMSEGFLPWIEFLSTLPGFEIKRFLPPTPEFQRYLHDDLGIQDVSGFIRGLALQKMDLIKAGALSSSRLAPLAEKIRGAKELNELLSLLTTNESIKTLSALAQFGAQFAEFSQRLHHKLTMVETDQGLEVMIEGRNWSDEYRLSLDSEVGKKALANRSYPFTDAGWHGVISDPASQKRMFDAYNDLWTSAADVAMPVVSSLSPDAHAEVRRRYESRADWFNVHWSEIEKWNYQGHGRIFLGPSNGVPFRYRQNLVTPGPNASGITEEWLEIIRGTQTELIIISAYFYLSDQMKEALKEAAARGVRIRVYTNDFSTTDMNMVNIAAYQAYDLWAREIGPNFQLFEMQMPASGKGSLHAKIIYSDGRILGLGSANVDPRTQDLDSNNSIFIPLSSNRMRRAGRQFVSRYTHGLEWRLVTPSLVAQRLAEWKQAKPTLFNALFCRAVIQQL